MNSKIVFRRMTAVWTVKTQSKRISSHLKNGSPTKPIRYKLVCEQNAFCYRDVRSYLEANYPKSLPFALKITLAFEIHGVMFSLLRCLLPPSPSSLLALNFKSPSSPGVLAPEVSPWGFSVWKIFPCEDLQSAFLCLLFCSICMRDRSRFTDSKHCFADDE